MAAEDSATKLCAKCGPKPISEFSKDKSRADGLCRICKVCNRATTAKWYGDNIDRGKATRALYYQLNRETALTRFQRYRQANLLKLRAASRTWAIANLQRKRLTDLNWRRQNVEKVRLFKRVSEHTRRAIKRASSGQYSARDVVVLYRKQKGHCACCRAALGKRYHIDHIMPLYLGGDNGKFNIQLLCPTCNMRKSAKHPVSFMQENGYLI